MTEDQFYNQLFELSPSYPLSVLQFLKTELQLGKKYVVLDIHQHNGQLTKLLQKHVHLICSLSPDPEYHHFLKNKFLSSPNFISINALPEMTNIEEDSIDCICIDESFEKYDVMRLGIEFERILRLNSYVLILNNQLHTEKNRFTEAYQQLWQQHYPQAIISPPLSDKNRLQEFYPQGYQQQIFQNQQRLDWEQLKMYFLVSLENRGLKPTTQALTNLKNIFDIHQKDHQINIDYQIIIHYGLFNYSVPEISLRKSIFFNILRPIAFGFYILVKANIYFWRAIYKLKEKLFGQRK